MAKLLCLCGDVLSSVSCPNEIEHVLLSDIVLDNSIGEIVDDVVHSHGIDVWVCPKCKSMAVFWERQNKATWYVPKED